MKEAIAEPSTNETRLFNLEAHMIEQLKGGLHGLDESAGPALAQLAQFPHEKIMEVIDLCYNIEIDGRYLRSMPESLDEYIAQNALTVSGDCIDWLASLDPADALILKRGLADAKITLITQADPTQAGLVAVVVIVDVCVYIYVAVASADDALFSDHFFQESPACPAGRV